VALLAGTLSDMPAARAVVLPSTASGLAAGETVVGGAVAAATDTGAEAPGVTDGAPAEDAPAGADAARALALAPESILVAALEPGFALKPVVPEELAPWPETMLASAPGAATALAP